MIDKYYLILVLPMILLSMWCQYNVTATFNKYEKISNKKGLTGAETARAILRQNGLNDIRVEQVSGKLSDHYDPRKRVLRLSESVFSSPTVAAVGVAAHECGHALQDAEKYSPLVLRGTLVPVANIGSAAGPYLAIIGLFMRFEILIIAGIVLFSIAVIFYLVTLPVEFNASKRALEVLEHSEMLYGNELSGSKKVLSAAALTYVASALVAIMSLLRLILLARGRKRD